jgi:hypothetical protein
MGGNNWVVLDEPLLHRPSEHAGERGAGMVRGDGTPFFADGANVGGDVRAGDVLDGQPAQWVL